MLFFGAVQKLGSFRSLVADVDSVGTYLFIKASYTGRPYPSTD